MSDGARALEFQELVHALHEVCAGRCIFFALQLLTLNAPGFPSAVLPGFG
jgi:hypothetical protein